MRLSNLCDLLTEPDHIALRRKIQKRLDSGKLTEDSPASKVIDSLDSIELDMEAEELGLTPEPGHTVKDLLRLLKTVEFQRERRSARIQ